MKPFRALLLALPAALALFAFPLYPQAKYQPAWESLDRRPTPQWYLDAKFGIFIHWGVYAVPSYAPTGTQDASAYAEWYWNALQRGPHLKNGPNPTWEFHRKIFGQDFAYQSFAPLFRAEFYDPAYWAEIFERSGARYVVLTSKHHDGFALWPSEHADKTWGHPWNSVSTGPRRDLLGELTTEVRKRGLYMGYYYSLYEWYNPLWLKDRERYVTEHMHPQFRDLVTRYQPALIFSDGEWDLSAEQWRSPELLAWLFNQTPLGDWVVVNDRWGKGTRHKHGGYFTTEYTAGLEDATHPWEENRGMGFSYGYNRAEQVDHYRTGRELILMLVDLVSRGGNLLLNIGPTADGRIPVIMQQRLLEIGRFLKAQGEAIYGTRPWRRTRQWSEGSVPKLETGEFMTRYEVTDYIEPRTPGQAVIEAFFTSKGDTVYAIVPGWPGSRLRLKNVEAPPGMQPVMLGSDQPLRWSAQGGDIILEMPPAPGDAVRAHYAYAIRLPGLRDRSR